MPQPQQVYDVLKRRFVKLEVEAEAHNIDQQTDSPELTGGSEAARQGLEADGQTLEEEVAEARLVLLGRNGVGKTTQLERWMLVGEKTSAHAGQAFALQLEDSDAYIEALKGCTFDEATYQGLQYIPTPADLCPDDTQHEVLAMLKEYASGTMPTASTPRSFLLAAGNPVGSTTGSITEVKYGNIPGAIEHFKSAQDLKEDAYRAFSQLRDTSAVLNIQQRDGLHCRWQVITGLSACPADLSSWENVPLCPDLHALAGVTRLYSGHDQRLATFASFLRKNLAANHVSPLVQVALERTIIFWPSTAGVVPIVDTPGTSDANSLNADTTHQAVSDAMARTSSQLLLCGEKTFETEGSLAEYVIPYFKHMITSKSGLPAIKGILMPNNQFHYGPAELASAHLQTEDKERVATSMAQLCKWLDMANKDLPTEQRASEAQLQTLQKRCEVRVVYTQLYASLCLQSSADLDGLAISANLSSNQLLSLTNGPWLLSLPGQLLAEITKPFIENLADEHVTQLAQRLKGQDDARLHYDMSRETSAAVHAQSINLRKKNSEARKLHLPVMRDSLKQDMKPFLQHLQGLFVNFAEQHQRQYTENADSILAEWQALYGKASYADQMLFFNQRSDKGVNRSKAFKTTFQRAPLGSDDKLAAAVQQAIDEFVHEHILSLLVNHAGQCLQASANEFDIMPLVQDAAGMAINMSLATMVKRLKGNLVREADLKACVRVLQVTSFRAHFTKGPLAGSSLTAQQQELARRTQQTLSAAEEAAITMFCDHIVGIMKRFETALVTDGRHFRAQLDNLMDKVLTQVGEVAKATQKVDGHKLQLHLAALQLQQDIRKEAASLLTADMIAGPGDNLAFSVHRKSLLNDQLASEFAAAGCYEAMQTMSIPEDQLIETYGPSQDISEKWQDIARAPSPVLHEANTLPEAPTGFCLVALTEDELAENSLPATIQRLFWPQAQGDARKSVHKMIRLAVALQLWDDWDNLQSAPNMKEIQMKADNGSALGLEEYVQQILSSPYLGVLELILFMRMAASECENVPEMYYQIWQGADALPAVLWYAPEASQASADTGTSPLPAVSLKLITLPLSKKLIWLPMARADQHDTGSADRFKQQLLALDAHNVAEARAKAKLAPSKQPQQSKPEPKSAFKRKLRSYRQAQPAHPAESSASVLVRKRPGPSPDSDSPTGKARHM